MSTSKYQWPENITDEADFETKDPTDPKQRLFVEGRVIAVKLSMSGNASKPDQVEFAFKVNAGQRGLLVGDHTLSDVGGKVVHATKSFNGGAQEYTWAALRKLGFDEQKAAAAYANDTQAVALKQAMKLKGRADEDITKAMGMLALTREDHTACGLGSVVARVTTKLDDSDFAMKQEAKGNPRRIRLDFVNSIPRDATPDDTLALLDAIGGTMSGRSTALKPPARTGTQTSAAPAGANTDSVEF